MKKILILASDFPPLAGTNVIRVQGFACYLPSHGWDPVVFTQAIEDMAQVDMQQLYALPRDLKVIRIKSPDPFLVWKRKKGVRPKEVLDVDKSNSEKEMTNRGGGGPIVSFISLKDLATRFLKFTFRHTWYCPDAKRPWAYTAAKSIVKYLDKSTTSVLYTSAPSYSCHVAGLYIKKKTDVPWVADFRDLWVARPGRQVPSLIHEYRDRRMERLVVHNADRILIASPFWKEVFLNRYGDEYEEKISYLPSGYDKRFIAPEDKDQVSDKTGRINFLYTGAMYRSESPIPFLHALGRLAKKKPQLLEKIRVKLIGYAGDETEDIKEILKKYSLEQFVEFPGVLPRRLCIQYQSQADVLLLFSSSEHHATISGKTYEYMASGKPIFAMISVGGAQDQILRPTGMAIIVQHEDVDAIEKKLIDILDGDLLSSLCPNWNYIHAFDTENITSKLAMLLDEMVV